MGRFLTRRDTGPGLDAEDSARKAVERAEMMSTAELLSWVESISATIAVSLGSYVAHRNDDTQLHEARRQTEVLHGVLTVLISRP